MTPDDLAAAVERLVVQAVEQGFPPTIEDPAVLAQIAAIVGGSDG